MFSICVKQSRDFSNCKISLRKGAYLIAIQLLVAVIRCELEALFLPCYLHSPLSGRTAMGMPTTKCQASSKWALYLHRIIQCLTFIPAEIPGVIQPSIPASESKFRWACESRTKKNHWRAVMCLHQKWRCSKYLLPESVILGRTEILEAEHKADRTGSHTEGSGLRCQSRSSSPCLDSFPQETRDTAQMILCILCLHHLLFINTSSGQECLKVRHDLQ